MKKLLSVLLVFVLLFGVCACSSSDTQHTDPSSSSQSTTSGTEAPTGSTVGATGTTQVPTKESTTAPTKESTTAPTKESTTAPTEQPTTAPTKEPTTAPTKEPTTAPTEQPTTAPTTCSHSYREATCTAPKTCSKCGATEGEAREHTYQNGVCSCGARQLDIGSWRAIQIDGNSGRRVVIDFDHLSVNKSQLFDVETADPGLLALSNERFVHQGKTYLAWYYEGCICAVECADDSVTIYLGTTEKTEGWSDIIKLRRSSATEMVVTKATGEGYTDFGVRPGWIFTYCNHSYKEATCTAPKTCSKCGATEGSAIGHSWSTATCTAPKTCATCKATEGEALPHAYKNASCIICSSRQLGYGFWRKMLAYSDTLDITELEFGNDPTVRIIRYLAMDTMDPAQLEVLLAWDREIINYQGRKYIEHSGVGDDMEYKVEGETMVMRSWGDNKIVSVTVKKTAKDQFTVVSTEDGGFYAIKEGDVFTFSHE